ncbi:type VI secretion system-associated FHA domain protein TagH [Jiella avicenniae]|uniref:Type VI secretion system-associated FHA domain protein TagH n=1 Tax=Jiella avicenniae TaxID=2907202 RepID=A0A9X1T4A2_9HYPH|nr:type VI secretion system-associated FHA domain protein TagH [Jiella avicenniae]MCE7028376.1 type VI secretion system-associated FHA domain protein TagH [Jiella avicenniae]
MRIDLVIENLDRLDDGGPIRFSATDRSFEIGREPPRDFVLPDPERLISSRHCEVRFDGGGFLLVDHSTNGTFVNGSDGRLARPKRLETGDRIEIGRYVLAVRITAAAGGWDDAPSPQPLPAVPRRGAAPSQAAAGEFGPASNPWAIDGPVAPPVDLQPPRQPNPPAFEDEVFGFDLPGPAAASPGPGGGWSPDRSDAADGPAARGEIDAAAGAWPRDDEGLDRPDQSKDDPFEINQPAPAAPPASAGASWPQPEARRRRAATPPDPRPIAWQEMPAGPSAVPEAPGAPQPAPSHAGAEAESLLSAIAVAAGLDAGAFADRPPEDAARQIGVLLAVVAGGVGDLLKMRAKAKTLTRSADRTTIEAIGNNPLKFSPTAEAALARMFGGGERGYLSARESFEEAFRDLSEHELITFAAMQKALKRLIDDLSPESVMARVPTSVVPYSRKAQAWDVFVNRWDAKTEPFEHGMLDVFLQYFREIYDEAGRARRR